MPSYELVDRIPLRLDLVGGGHAGRDMQVAVAEMADDGASPGFQALRGPSDPMNRCFRS